MNSPHYPQPHHYPTLPPNPCFPEKEKFQQLHHWFEHSAQQYPEHIAVEIPPTPEDPQRYTYTYKQLNHMATWLAIHLASLVKPNSIVAIILPRNSHHMYAAQLAVLKAGAAYTCLEPSWPEERIQFILQDSQAIAVLSNEDFMNGFDLPTLDHEHLWINVVEWLDELDSAAVEYLPSAAYALRPAAPQDLCYVIYTSGTTGTPKGVMIEHRNISNLLHSNVGYFDIRPTDRVGQGTSTSFDASVEEIYLAFAFGATLVVLNDDVVRSGPDLVVWLRQERISVTSPTPTFLRMCLCHDPATSLPDLRLLYVGGESLPADLAKLWAPRRWLENAYGPTECTVTVMRGRVYPNLPVTIGCPVEGNQAWVLDEHLEDVGTGQRGELCISGLNVARGYLNRPELTAQKFVNHPKYGRIYRTGDLVERLPSGEYMFHGRIDTQVKIRGYRIELEAIEAYLCQIPGLLQAACTVQGSAEHPTLVAFVVFSSTNHRADEKEIKAALAEHLPTYMIPSIIRSVEHLPFNSSGKLDRKALPQVETPCRAVVSVDSPPQTSLEKLVAHTILKYLPGIANISIHDDFFDLGGTSVAAAQVISDLRNHPETKNLTVRDLYVNRTIHGLLAKILHSVPATPSTQRQPSSSREQTKGKPALITTLQLLTLIQGTLLASALGYVVGFVILPPVIGYLGLGTFLLLSPVLGIFLLAVYLPLSLVLTLVAKRILIGKYQPGRYPLWSGMFLRHWVLQNIANTIPWNLIRGTVFQNMLLRVLGANIGKDVHIHVGVDFRGGWDLLTIGDGATLGRDVNLRVIDYEAQEIVFGPIVIGAHCTLGTRSGMSPHSSMEDNSSLTPLTMLPAHTTIPTDQVWEGVPAAYKMPTPPVKTCTEQPWSETRHGITFMLVHFLLNATAALPGLFLFLGIIFYYQVSTATAVQWLYTPAWGSFTLLVILGLTVAGSVLGMITMAIEIRLLGKIKPGVYSRWRGTYILIWIKQRMLERVGNTLSGTLFWPWWLRLAGMKLGRDCEISTIYDVVPEQIEVGPETFFADGIYLGPAVDRGVVDCSLTTFGRHTFLGNHAVIPPGCQLPDDILIGVCTVADPQKIRPGSSWFGHPIFELPRREVVEVDRRLTHNPPWTQYVSRLSWESLRFLFPVLPMLITLVWFKTLLTWQAAQHWAVFFFVTLPLYGFAMGFILVFVVWAAKWLLLGKVKPGQHGLWSSWIYRWDFLYMLWARYARPVLSPFHYTLVLSWWMRAMGAKVGKHVVLAGGFSQVVDPDMLHFHDDSTVACMFQAHSFEDRVLKLGHVHLRERSTVGTHTVVLYGADIGADTLVEAQSVVMKHEKLLPQHHYLGCPTQPV